MHETILGLYAIQVGGSIFSNTVTPLEGRGILIGGGSGMLVLRQHREHSTGLCQQLGISRL